MEQLIGNIEALVLMYVPIAFCYVTQVLTLYVNWKRAKASTIKEQVKPITDSCKELVGAIGKLKETNDGLREENKLLKEALIKELSKKDHFDYKHSPDALKERLK